MSCAKHKHTLYYHDCTIAMFVEIWKVLFVQGEKSYNLCQTKFRQILTRCRTLFPFLQILFADVTKSLYFCRLIGIMTKKGLIILIVACLCTGCGEYQKLLKSTDPELKYEKAIEYFSKIKG